MAIRTPDQRLRVFVSSTLGELAEERQAVARAIAALRLTPVLVEAGARPHPPRALYRAYLAQSDVFVGLYWQRYGQVGHGMAVSGLEEGFQPSAGLPRLLYVKAPAPDREPRLAELLSRIRQEASYRTFRTPGELGRLVRDDLATLLGERFTAARPRPQVPASPARSRGPRLRMLETIREFVAERLAARRDAAQIQRRHADHCRALAEQADRPLRGAGQKLRGAGQTQRVERLQAEAGNLTAAVRWYLANDPAPLPHLFRVLWPFWSQRDHLGEARAWVQQLLPTADSLDPQARAELLWTALVTAREVGDDPAALSARQRLGPLLAGIDDPYLHAVSQLAMAWTSPIIGDFAGAFREAPASLEEFRGQDEPLWTAAAVGSLGGVEAAVGRYDDAQRHLREARDLPERVDNVAKQPA